MATHVKFQNPKTGETKTVKVGFSWVLLFFSGFFGLALFLRGLHIWGGVMAGLWGANLLIQALLIETGAGQVVTTPIVLASLGLSIWFAIKGNAMTAKNYLEKGWKTLEPESDAVKHARNKWGLSEISPVDSGGNGDGTALNPTPTLNVNQPEAISTNTGAENEAGQEPKSYAAKPRSFKSVFQTVFYRPMKGAFGFSRQARQRRKELREEQQKAGDESLSFSGRASRSEFWWTVGAYFLASTSFRLFLLLIEVIFDTTVPDFHYLIAGAVFWFSIPVTVRRFHDIGNSGWWTVLVVGPLVAFEILIFLKIEAMEKYDEAMERYEHWENAPGQLYTQPQMPWVMPEEALGNLAIVAVVCLIVGYIVLSRKGTPEKTRFDKDD